MRASIIVQNELILASFSSGNVWPLCIRSLLVKCTTTICAKFETNQRYKLHNPRKSRSCIKLDGECNNYTAFHFFEATFRHHELTARPKY